MPGIHEIMNIFADADDEGAHPPMPSVNEFLDKPWVAHGQYFTGGESAMDRTDVNRWWRKYRQNTNTYQYSTGGPGQMVPIGTWHYAGYVMQEQLWTGDDAPEAKFLERLPKLINVASISRGENASTTYEKSTIWDISTSTAELDDFLETYAGDEDSGLFNVYTGLDVPDSAMQGSAAGVFAARVYDLAARMTHLSMQLHRFHNEVSNLREPLLPKIYTLVEKYNNAIASPNSTIKKTLDNWYFNVSAGTERWQDGGSRFTILIHADPPSRGVVGTPEADEAVNNELKARWLTAWAPVIIAANDLYSTMASHYEGTSSRLKKIYEPVGGLPPGFNQPTDGPGGDGPDGDSDGDGVPDWLEDLYGGDGPDGDGP
ncbi:hypothetical protein, partial [Nocardiopsis sp. CNT312]|uniref:hypothetical protein n=1 Tax=Nocardiopsis sp. CNT312 TaxID=1137268 RepID=UPI0005628437